MRIEGFDIDIRRPTYIEARCTGIAAWFDNDLAQTRLFELKAAEPLVPCRVAQKR